MAGVVVERIMEAFDVVMSLELWITFTTSFLCFCHTRRSAA